MNIYIWLAILIISLVVEASTATLVAVWFAPAAVICMILEALSVPTAVQISAFVIISGLLMLLFYKKLRDNIKQKAEKTNLDAVIGSEGVVEEDIQPYKYGRVKIGGISWAAYIEKNAETIEKGQVVKVLKIDGVKLLVEKSKVEQTKAETLTK